MKEYGRWDNEPDRFLGLVRGGAAQDQWPSSEVNHRLLKDILLVTDTEILVAMEFLFERLKVVAEPSGASAFAALLARKCEVANLRVGIVISGGNVGVQRFCQLLGEQQKPLQES